jgi:thymidylate synthase (FAD)
MYTSFIWTVSLEAALHFLDLRLGAGAQREIISYAKCLREIVNEIAPHTLAAWESRRDKEKRAMDLFKKVSSPLEKLPSL